MAESENSSNNCETVKISIGTIIQDLKVIVFVPDYLKIKKKYENVVKKFMRYETINTVGRLRLIPNCYKNQKILDKAVDDYTHALEFVPECY